MNRNISAGIGLEENFFSVLALRAGVILRPRHDQFANLVRDLVRVEAGTFVQLFVVAISAGMHQSSNLYVFTKVPLCSLCPLTGAESRSLVVNSLKSLE